MAENDIPESTGGLRPGFREKLKRTFDAPFFAMVALAVAAGVATWYLKGPASFHHAMAEAQHYAVYILPRMTAALLIAAFLQVLLPRQLVARLIGDKAGIGGILIGTVAGGLTPGGPLTAFPIVVALYATGANKGALVAYISAWAMFGFQRILVWEYPLMGGHFTLLHVLSSLALPVLAGLIALRLPWEIRAPAAPEMHKGR